MSRLPRNDDGKLPAYAWPGGYPLYYLFADCEVCCPDCANGENGSDASEDADDRQWKLIACDVNYEDENLFCAHCNKRIKSAYGEETDEEP
jgi:hypothetical protein